MHFTGGDHGRDAAMKEAVDPVLLLLARRPVAEHRMHVAVDQAGRDGGAVGVDDGAGAGLIHILGAADRCDLAADGDDGVGIQDRAVEVAAQQQADIADHELRRAAGFLGLFGRHDVSPCWLSETLVQAQADAKRRVRVENMAEFGRKKRSAPGSRYA
jgi:hypothetical protein